MNVSISTELSNHSTCKKNIPLRFWFIGDHGVGKSSLIYKFLLETIPKNILPTIGRRHFYIRKQGLENCKKLYHQYEISLWDTAGIEKFRTNMNITKQIKFPDVVFCALMIS